jgi:hypothetical protein
MENRTKEEQMEQENCKGHTEAESSVMYPPIKLEAKLGMQCYEGQLDAEILNKWIRQMEVYFGTYGYTNIWVYK